MAPFQRITDPPTGAGGLPWEGQAGGGVPPWHPSQMTGLFASFYATNVTLVGGSDVDVLVDQTAALDLQAPTAGERPPLKVASVNMGGADTLDFEAAPDKLVGQTAADWIPLHSKGSYAVAFWSASTSSMAILDTNNGSDAARGFTCRYFSSGTLLTRAGNGSAGVYAHSETGVSLSTQHIVVVRMDTANTPQYSVRIDGVEEGSGTFSNAVDASAPGQPLTMGRAFVSLNFDGEIPFLLCANEYWPDDEVLELEAWSASNFGTP